jgi:uncharacterized protein
MSKTSIRVTDNLANIPNSQWDALVDGNPTLKHAWLQSMIDADCTTVATGWLPQFILLSRELDMVETLVGAVPLYMKNHSYGEYVFDWAWAEAYQRAGLDYYPKLLSAIPFTPCSGARILALNDIDKAILIDALIDIAKNSEVSSLHVLFATDDENAALAAKGLMARHAVQFHWQNAGYATFDDFLSCMNHDKRKKIRQERKAVANAGVTLQRKVGSEITALDWDFFTRCYVGTYRAHRSTPYLNRAFFGLIGERMPDNILLVIASRNGVPIAASLNLFSDTTLYGRYWGTTEFVSGLHFETCYYQTLEFCIERGIQVFEGGAQGEHKLARGFKPVACQSAHWIRDPRFKNAVSEFLRRESSGIERYVDELSEHAPFKKMDE